jgi:hypothetical protein
MTNLATRARVPESKNGAWAEAKKKKPPACERRELFGSLGGNSDGRGGRHPTGIALLDPADWSNWLTACERAPGRSRRP